MLKPSDLRSILSFFRGFWSRLDAILAPLGSSGGPIGPWWPPGGSQDPPGSLLDSLPDPLGVDFGANLGPTWGNMEPTWPNLRQLGANMRPTWVQVGSSRPSWGYLEASWGTWGRGFQNWLKFDRNFVDFWPCQTSPNLEKPQVFLRFFTDFRKSWKTLSMFKILLRDTDGIIEIHTYFFCSLIVLKLWLSKIVKNLVDF